MRLFVLFFYIVQYYLGRLLQAFNYSNQTRQSKQAIKFDHTVSSAD